MDDNNGKMNDEERASSSSSTTDTKEIPSTSPKPTVSSKSPLCLIVLGMAGSGKTTFVQRLSAHLYGKSDVPYVINLDPAVREVPYPANIDIRDTVNYKEVMKQYNLGPNGAILTSLNLFTTRFDQVIGLVEKHRGEYNYVLFDTPGQIEVFTWSASGSIITETLASLFPTAIVYVLDSARSVNPVTFMSNMLYACSILYKMKLPFVVVMNKADIVNPQFAMEWIKDFEKFQESLAQETTYMSDLTRSLSLVLDEFYSDLKCVGFSSVSGDGLNELFDVLTKCREEYEKEYRPEYERLKAEKDAALVAEQAKQLEQVKIDIAEDKVQKRHLLSNAYDKTSHVSRGQRFHIGGVEMEEEEDQMFGEDEDEEEEDEEKRMEAENKSFETYVKSLMSKQK